MRASSKPSNEKRHQHQRKKQEQITENTLTDRSRIPDEQNAWKETQPQYKR